MFALPLMGNLKTYFLANARMYGERDGWLWLAYLPIRVKVALAALRYVGQSPHAPWSEAVIRKSGYLESLSRHVYGSNSYPIPVHGMVFWRALVRGAFTVMWWRLRYRR